MRLYPCPQRLDLAGPAADDPEPPAVPREQRLGEREAQPLQIFVTIEPADVDDNRLLQQLLAQTRYLACAGHVERIAHEVDPVGIDAEVFDYTAARSLARGEHAGGTARSSGEEGALGQALWRGSAVPQWDRVVDEGDGLTWAERPDLVHEKGDVGAR